MLVMRDQQAISKQTNILPSPVHPGQQPENCWGIWVRRGQRVLLRKQEDGSREGGKRDSLTT